LRVYRVRHTIVVNKRLRPAALLTLVRRHARRHGCVVVETPGRGKGSHRLYVVQDSDELEVGRFTVPGHPRELSWTVLRSIEDALSHEFGERWMEEK
jgi:predicted RNA binding protein YcfA (HicA-like mRNA interferase family)